MTFDTGNPFRKNDPIYESVRKVMETNELHREVVSVVNESLGIEDRKALPFEIQSDYDTLLKNVFESAQVDEAIQKQIRMCSKTARQTLKKQGHSDIHQNIFNSPGTEEVFNKVKKYLHSIGFLGAPISEEDEQLDEVSRERLTDYLKRSKTKGGKKAGRSKEAMDHYHSRNDTAKSRSRAQQRVNRGTFNHKTDDGWKHNQPYGLKEDEQIDEDMGLTGMGVGLLAAPAVGYATNKVMNWIDKKRMERNKVKIDKERSAERAHGAGTAAVKKALLKKNWKDDPELSKHTAPKKKLKEDEQIDEVVSAADLAKSGLTLGQYMNKERGLTARKGGANDPDVIRKNQLAAKPAATSSASKTASDWKAPSGTNQADTVKASGAPTPAPAPAPKTADVPTPASLSAHRPAGIGQPGNDASNFVKKQLSMNEEVKPVTYKIV